MSGFWNMSITFSVPMEICLSPLVKVMNYIDLIVYQFYWDKLHHFSYIVSIEWVLYTLNLFSSSVYSKLISTHSDWTLGECMGQVRGRAPACLVLNGQSVHRYEHQWDLVFICFWSWSLWNTVHQTSKAGESSWLSLRGTQFILLFQSATSKTRFHCKIFWHNGVGLAPLGQGLERVMTQSSSEEHLPHLSSSTCLSPGTWLPWEGGPGALLIEKWDPAETWGYTTACGNNPLNVGQREGRDIWCLTHL